MEPEKKNAPELLSELAGSDGEQGHEEKLDRYGKAKTHQKEILSHILQFEPSLSREAEAMEDCSQTLIFRNWYTVGQYRLIGGCTCKKHLLCPMCALRRSAKMVREIEKKIKTLLLENPSLVPVLITMTIKNGEDLAERYSHINGAKKKLLHKRRNALSGVRLKNKSVMRFIHGSVGSYEFKKGQGGHGWHPHSHEIALLLPGQEFVEMVDKSGMTYQCPINFQVSLSQEWHKITGDSFVVDVRKIEKHEGMTEEESLLKAICEASKYALKLTGMDKISDQIEAYKVLRGHRLTFSYGSLWGIVIPDDMHDTIEDELKLLPYVDLVYGFYESGYLLEEITDTGDTLFKSSGFTPKKEKDKNKRLAALGRFAVQVDEYAAEVKHQEEQAFQCCFDAPVTLEQKVLYREHLQQMEVEHE